MSEETLSAPHAMFDCVTAVPPQVSAPWADIPAASGGDAAADVQCESTAHTSTELVQLHTRVIALENLMIALLADATERQIDLARGMASYIAPRPEATQHSLTAQAATQMLQFVDRANHFRVATT